MVARCTGEPVLTATSQATGFARKHKFLTIFVSVLILFLLAEGAVRLVADRLPQPEHFHDPAVAVKYEQMEEIQDAGETREVVFAGSSMMNNGADPNEFTELTGISSYNSAFPAANPFVTERWVLEEVVPRLKPKAVVYDVTSLGLNGAVPDSNSFPNYNKSWQMRQGLLPELERWAAERSDLVYFRPVLQNPSNYAMVAKGLRGEDTVSADTEFARNRRYGQNGAKNLIVENLTQNNNDWLAQTAFKAWNIDNKQSAAGLAALARQVDALEEQDIDVFFVEMPVQQGYIDLHPRGVTDYEEAMDVFRQFATDHDVTWIDLPSDYSDPELFHDLNHLAQPGADQLTQDIAAYFNKNGV